MRCDRDAGKHCKCGAKRKLRRRNILKEVLRTKLHDKVQNTILEDLQQTKGKSKILMTQEND